MKFPPPATLDDWGENASAALSSELGSMLQAFGPVRGFSVLLLHQSMLFPRNLRQQPATCERRPLAPMVSLRKAGSKLILASLGASGSE